MAREAVVVAELRPDVLRLDLGGMKMRKFLAIIILTLSAAVLPAIGFGYHVFEIRTEPEFGHGVFPVSVRYQFNFPVPDIIDGCKTELAFRLDNGLVYRTLRQDPSTGAIMAMHPELYDFPREYTVHFDEFNLFYGQGFFETDFSDNDLLTVFASIDGRFEMAFERLTWMTSPSERGGVFWDESGNYRFADSSWVGAPELAGNRSVFQTSLTTGLILDYMHDETVVRSGVRGGSYWRICPRWMILNDGSGDYMLSWNELQFSATLFSERQQNGLHWFSIVLDDWVKYRWILGPKVPAYIQGGEMWGPDVPNAAHVFTNRLAVTFYGPQIGSRDIYPSVSVFWDLGLGLGKVLNSSLGGSISELVGSYGIRAEFVIAGIAEFFFEIGCSYEPVFRESPYVDWKMGFSIGV